MVNIAVSHHVNLILNVSLILVLVTLYGMLTRLREEGKPGVRIVSGLLFGLITIVAMMVPVHYAPGIIYDGRAIILGIAGLFGGGLVSAVSIVVAGAYQVYIGGGGVWAGLAIIIGSTMVGLAFRRAYGNRPETLSIPVLFGVGISVCVVMLACQLLVQPWPTGLDIIQHIGLPVMLIFPAGTVLMALLLSSENRRIEADYKRQASERKYRQILENMQENYYEIDLAGNLTFFNTSLCQLLGYSREELMGLNNREYTDAENAKRLYKAFNRVYRTGKDSTGFDWEIIRKDGSRRTIEASVSLRKDSSGKPIGFRGIIRDVTEKKLAEQMLRESEERFRSLYDNVSIGLYRTTVDGRILMSNPALVQMLGYSSFEELAQVNLESESYYEAETPRLRFKKSLEQNGFVTGLESAWKRKDGTILWVRESAKAFRDENGKISYYEGSVEDITERKQAEEKLRESEEKYRLIFNNAPLGLFHYDKKGLITSCNDKFVEIIGSSRERLVGLSVLNLPDKQIVEAVRKTFSGSFGYYEDNYKSVTADKITPVRVLFTPLISEGGEVLGGIGISEDISERKQAEAERESLQEQLLQSQKMESVGRLAGGVAHDYNNMLGVVLGRAEMVLSKMSPDDPNRGSMEAIMRAGERSADLTRQLLAFARKQTIQPKVLNLNGTIEHTLKILRQVIGENIELDWQPGNGLWAVEMDPVQVDQILANLCVNARDAISGTGKVSIETENKVIDEPYCAAHSESIPGRYVMLAVSDDGCGMDEETRSHIFDPFFTTKEVGKGTGLGLSTVYGIVKQNSGFINVYSEPGEGTTFRIYIPQSGDRVSEETVTKVTEIPRGKGQQILLVEDEVVLLEMAKTMLEELGYQVQTASLPVEALSYLQENTRSIDLLITDVVMPGMSGKELVEEVRKLCDGVKVLFMSGYTANAIAHQGVLDKDVAFIQKPFSLRELAKKVREVLDKP